MKRACTLLSLVVATQLALTPIVSEARARGSGRTPSSMRSYSPPRSVPSQQPAAQSGGTQKTPSQTPTSAGYSATEPRNIYGRPVQSAAAPKASRTATSPQAQPQGNSWAQRSPILTGLAAGLAGSMLGNLLFGNSAAASGATGTGLMGNGLLLLLLAGFAYAVFRFVRKAGPPTPKPADAGARQNAWNRASTTEKTSSTERSEAVPADPPFSGAPTYLAPAETLEPSDLEAFRSLFETVQRAWTAQHLAPLLPHLAADLYQFLLDGLVHNQQQHVVNRVEQLEDIRTDALRSWQTSEGLYTSVRISWKALDYTFEEASAEGSKRLIEGSDQLSQPFTEIWTFFRLNDQAGWVAHAIEP